MSFLFSMRVGRGDIMEGEWKMEWDKADFL